MRRSRWMQLAAAGTLSAVMALGAIAASPGAAVAAGPAAPAVTYPTTSAQYTIPTHDGVVLAAKVWSPTGATGPLPLVLIPSAWGGESGQMFWAADQLAQRGFVAVNYATRGFQDSGGVVELASPNDIRDVSDIIDWSVENVGADGSRVGMWGLSYGAGMSLLAAAQDPRLKAVGSLEGFADLGMTAYPNRTRSIALVAGLKFGAVIAGTLSDEVDKSFDYLLSGDDPQGIEPAHTLDGLATRSPINVIDRINKNGPAVFLATSWNDTAYGSDQMTTFYNRLTTTKRLEVRPGDHAFNEVPGAVGVGPATDMYQHLFDWMTTYVAGRDTAVVHEAPVWIQPRSSGTRPATETYQRFEDITEHTRTQVLTAPGGIFQPTGGIGTGPATTWSTTLKQGGDIAGGVGVPVVNFGQEALGLKPPSVALWATDRSRSGLWLGAAATSTVKLRGTATATLNVTPSAASGTVVIYLYDADAAAPGGTGYIISHRPYSFFEATPGKALRFSVGLQPTAYDLPKGHRLGLAVSTGDPIYANENPDGATLRLTSTPAAPITLTIQTGS